MKDYHDSRLLRVPVCATIDLYRVRCPGGVPPSSGWALAKDGIEPAPSLQPLADSTGPAGFFVSGAGVAECNGTYQRDGSYSSAPLYKQLEGPYWLLRYTIKRRWWYIAHKNNLDSNVGGKRCCRRCQEEADGRNLQPCTCGPCHINYATTCHIMPHHASPLLKISVVLRARLLLLPCACDACNATTDLYRVQSDADVPPLSGWTNARDGREPLPTFTPYYPQPENPDPSIVVVSAELVAPDAAIHNNAASMAPVQYVQGVAVVSAALPMGTPVDGWANEAPNLKAICSLVARELGLDRRAHLGVRAARCAGGGDDAHRARPTVLRNARQIARDRGAGPLSTRGRR